MIENVKQIFNLNKTVCAKHSMTILLSSISIYYQTLKNKTTIR